MGADRAPAGRTALAAVMLLPLLLPASLRAQEPSPETAGEGSPRDASAPQGAAVADEVAPGAPSSAELADPLRALEEGNRLFEEGQLEAAAEAYRRGWTLRSPNSTLVYNLATTLHHLDRLPEAILWYRRGDPQDPWLEENLWLARRSLGSQRLPLDPGLDWLVRNRRAAIWSATILAWLALGLAAAGTRLPRTWVWIVLAAAAGLYTGGHYLDARGPKGVVLLQDCETGAGDLPAGTEAWVRRSGDQWRIVGTTSITCPLKALGFVEPRQRPTDREPTSSAP